MEEDLVIGGEEDDYTDDKPSPLAIIEKQLDVITYVSEIDTEIYDQCMEDKIKVITRALRLIYKIQGQLMKDG